MKLKIGFSAFIMLLFGTITFAQESYMLKGKVTSASDNTTIPGVNVVVKEGTKASVTDIEGKYEISVKPGDVLEFSFIGYTTQSVTIEGQKTLDVKLSENENSLDDVFIVGY